MKSRLFIWTAALLMAATASFAHHADLNYDKEHPITLTGTVTEFVFMNPHVRISFDVKGENGVVTHWVAEAGPPHRMYRAGFNRDSLRPGDSITVTGGPKKEKNELFLLEMPKPAR